MFVDNLRRDGMSNYPSHEEQGAETVMKQEETVQMNMTSPNESFGIKKLPNELLIGIFLSFRNQSISMEWITVTWVCKYWRAAALAAPFLWTDVRHVTMNPACFQAGLDRSGELDVDITIEYVHGIDTAIAQGLLKDSHRIRSLHIPLRYPDENMQSIVQSILYTFPRLARLGLIVQRPAQTGLLIPTDIPVPPWMSRSYNQFSQLQIPLLTSVRSRLQNTNHLTHISLYGFKALTLSMDWLLDMLQASPNVKPFKMHYRAPYHRVAFTPAVDSLRLVLLATLNQLEVEDETWVVSNLLAHVFVPVDAKVVIGGKLWTFNPGVGDVVTEFLPLMTTSLPILQEIKYLRVTTSPKFLHLDTYIKCVDYDTCGTPASRSSPPLSIRIEMGAIGSLEKHMLSTVLEEIPKIFPSSVIKLCLLDRTRGIDQCSWSKILQHFNLLESLHVDFSRHDGARCLFLDLSKPDANQLEICPRLRLLACSLLGDDSLSALRLALEYRRSKGLASVDALVLRVPQIWRHNRRGSMASVGSLVANFTIDYAFSGTSRLK